MKKVNFLVVAGAISLMGIVTTGCSQKQDVLTKDEQQQFGKYGQPMTPEVRAKYEAAMKQVQSRTSSASSATSNSGATPAGAPSGQ